MTAPISQGSRFWTNVCKFESLCMYTLENRLKSKTGAVKLASPAQFAHSRCAERNSATHSTCCVCGNMSNGITCFSSKTPDEAKMFKSRARVAGWQDT